MASNGTLFVVSAPSGAGKTTLIQQVLNRFSALSYSVSHTTRSPREGEVHGEDYFFVTIPEFEALIEAGQMLEYAQVHDNYYGTSKTFVADTLDQGKSLLLDIDVQGAKQIMDSGLNPVSIFIMPPSMDELKRRLEGRGTDAPGVIARRLENATGEMAARDAYDHVLVNDDLDRAVAELSRIFAQYTEAA
ncbi:MAG: guanylate kinase [Desulfobacterales bacterium]|nr:guanylate kinase [Desulfobacterales bacterium]